jgi:hypothetical protein
MPQDHDRFTRYWAEAIELIVSELNAAYETTAELISMIEDKRDRCTAGERSSLSLYYRSVVEMFRIVLRIQQGSSVVLEATNSRLLRLKAEEAVQLWNQFTKGAIDLQRLLQDVRNIDYRNYHLTSLD